MGGLLRHPDAGACRQSGARGLGAETRKEFAHLVGAGEARFIDKIEVSLLRERRGFANGQGTLAGFRPRCRPHQAGARHGKSARNPRPNSPASRRRSARRIARSFFRLRQSPGYPERGRGELRTSSTTLLLGAVEMRMLVCKVDGLLSGTEPARSGCARRALAARSPVRPRWSWPW